MAHCALVEPLCCLRELQPTQIQVSDEVYYILFYIMLVYIRSLLGNGGETEGYTLLHFSGSYKEADEG